MSEMHIYFLPASERSVHTSKSKMNTMWCKSRPREFRSKPQSPELVGVPDPCDWKSSSRNSEAKAET